MADGDGDGGVQAVARTYLVLGLAVAAFALYAISLDPATFRQLQLQMIKESDPHPAEQGQMDCAVTAAEALEMRAEAVLLLLLAAAQALMATLAGTSRVRTVLAQLVSVPMAAKLSVVLVEVVRVAIGRCHDHGIYHHTFLAFYVGVSFAALLIAGLVVLGGKIEA